MRKHHYTQNEIQTLAHDPTYIYSHEKDPNRAHLDFEIVKNPEETGRRLTFHVSARQGFTDIATKRHISALELGEIVVNTKEYRDWLLGYKFTTVPTRNGKKLTNQQIYDIQMTGQERLTPEKDYKLTIHVTMYEENNSTVGYTYGNTVRTWVNNKFFKQYSLGEIFGNAWHEGCHKYGFDHSSASDHSSVPYACGYKVRDMIREYEKGRRYTDLYPATPGQGQAPSPKPTPPITTKKKVCGWTWRFWLGRICWYE